MMGGDDMDLGQMMPLMLMTQLGQTAPTGDGDEAANPLAGMAQMMPMMMMMNMMGGDKSSNGSGPFGGGNFFDRSR